MHLSPSYRGQSLLEIGPYLVYLGRGLGKTYPGLLKDLPSPVFTYLPSRELSHARGKLVIPYLQGPIRFPASLTFASWGRRELRYLLLNRYKHRQDRWREEATSPWSYPFLHRQETIPLMPFSGQGNRAENGCDRPITDGHYYRSARTGTEGEDRIIRICPYPQDTSTLYKRSKPLSPGARGRLHIPIQISAPRACISGLL